MSYFDEMKAVSYNVDQIIETSLTDYREFNLRSIFEKRKEHPKMRPYLTQVSFEYCGGEGDISHINALSEINTLHLYLDNWIFDNKNGVWNSENKERTISDITINSQVYEKLTGTILSIMQLDPAKELKIRKEFDRQIIACYKGQKVDLEIDVTKAFNFKTDEEFLSFYCELPHPKGCGVINHAAN